MLFVLRAEEQRCACWRKVESEEVGGRTVWVGKDVMQHLGCVLPLTKETRLTKKAEVRMSSVHELWAQESEIPLAVCREQYRAEVLRGLRHQEQVARLPEEIAGGWQRKLEIEIRRIAGLGGSISAEYLRAPRPWGLGFGEIELEGAVDYIMGMGQLRWAARETKIKVLEEIRKQLRTQGVCTRVTLPQNGPWEYGSHTIVRDFSTEKNAISTEKNAIFTEKMRFS